MKIQFGDYTLQPGMYAKDRWDVLKKKQIIMSNFPNMLLKYPKAEMGSVVGENDIELAYDMHLEDAIKKVISYMLADKEDTVDLKGYLREYKKQVETLENLLKA